MTSAKKVVVLMEKYCDLNPHLGTTSAYFNIVGSLMSSDDYDVKVYHYDEYVYDNGQPIDGFLLNTFMFDKPDYLVVSFYPFEDPRNVRLETLSEIKKMGIPVIFIWFDFGHHHLRQLAQHVTAAGSLGVIVDTCDIPEGSFMHMWVPQDEQVFKPGNKKDIDVSFVGTVGHYNTRLKYISYILSHRHLHVSGGQREHRLTIDEYAETLQRSKISLNFPDKPDGTIQAKCRIYESMLCKSMLLEKENSAISRWFTPMEDYIPFSTEQDLLEKINYFLNHEEERNKIVENAFNKMRNAYSSKEWWSRVFTKVS